ncbi:MAG TPA: outer membrane beta-barrel family protein [Puia sp.]|nr:outer membrane beta-barrel family protein [Puia sp.]
MTLKITLPLIFILLGALLFHAPVHAQNHGTGAISGKLLDSATKEGLKGATLVLRDGKDSTRWKYSLSKEGGVFRMTELTPGPHTLSVSFQGHEGRTLTFSVSPAGGLVALGPIYLPLAPNTLDAVTVTATPGVRVKKDTLQFSPSMFHAKPNADLGEVIGKMPGMEVDRNGNVTAQGEKVQRVLVNGKRFFSNDPTMAIKNLPPDVIARIEVFDDWSDQSKFTGIDDGKRVKTLNIITKRNINRGEFGKVIASGGASQEKGLYDETVSLHHFNNNQMLSVIGQANNDNGLTTTLSGGANYSDQWGKTTKAYGSYQVNHSKTTSGQKSSTENLIPGDSSLLSQSQQDGVNSSLSHNVNFNTESKFDPFNSLTARTSMSWQNGSSGSQSTTGTTKGVSIPVNNSNLLANNSNRNYTGNMDLLFGHRFGRKGRSISLGVTAALGSGSGNGIKQYYNQYHTAGLPDSDVTVNQYSHSPSQNKSLSTTLSYLEPLSKRSALEFNYNYSVNNAETGRYTFDYDSATHSYNKADSLLTNHFVNEFSSHRLGLTYRYNSQQVNFNTGIGVQQGNTSSRNLSKSTQLDQQYTNLYPTVNFTYNLPSSAHVTFSYNGRTSQPSLDALQPLTDNSDPLHVKIGNPDLKQQFTHSFRLLYNFFDKQSFRNLFVTINANILDNNIVNKTNTNVATGADTTTWVNLDGSYSLSANFNYGFRLKNPSSNLNFTTNIADNHTVGFVNDQLNASTNYSLSQTVKWTTNLREHFDVNFSATPTYNLALYSAEADQDNHYFSTQVTADATWFTKSGWMVGSDVAYTSYSGRAAGFNTSTMVWNGYLARLLFPTKRGELRLSVHDLLDQNASLNRTVTPTMIQDTESKVLTRYFMLSFTYHIRHFTGTAPTNPNKEG